MRYLHGRFPYRACFLCVALGAVACGSDSSDGESTGNGHPTADLDAGHMDDSGGSGGSGGTGALGVGDPIEGVTTAEECASPSLTAAGGGIAVYCDIITIQLSRPVERSDLSFSIQTSEGDTFGSAQGGATGIPAFAVAFGDPVDRLGLSSAALLPTPGYAPTFVDVEVSERGISVGSARFDQLGYHCFAEPAGLWCWEAEPVTLVLHSADAGLVNPDPGFTAPDAAGSL